MGDSSMDTNMGSMKKDDKKTATTTGTTTPMATTDASGATTPMATTLAMKKPTAEAMEGFNLLETERGSFNKRSSSIPANKTISPEGFEPYSGSNQGYSPF